MKKVLALLLAGLMVISLAACGNEKTEEPAAEETTGGEEETPDASTEEAIKIGFALMNSENAVWQTMCKGMQAGADEIGAEFQVFDASNDVQTQITNIENMITMGFDAIIVHVFDTEAFADVCQKALDEGIVICSYDDVVRNPSTGNPLDYQFDFLCSNYEIGHRVGQMAAEWSKATFEGDEPIQFGLLWNPEFEYHHDRRQGMEDAFAEIDPRIEIVDDYAGIDTVTGAAACEAWLASQPNLKGVVACGDGPLLGYLEAWTAAGKDAKDPNFGTFGNDGVDDAIDAIYEGTILRGDVALDVFNGGSDVVKTCATFVNGGTADSIIMPMFNATADTVEEWMGTVLYNGQYK